MSGRVWHWLVDGKEGSQLYSTLDAAKEGLDQTLNKHTDKGHKVRFEVSGEGAHPLWIVEDSGEIIAKYRLIE